MIVSYGGSLKHDDPIVEEMRLKGQWCKQNYGVFSHKLQKVILVPTLSSFYLVFDKRRSRTTRVSGLKSEFCESHS